MRFAFGIDLISIAPCTALCAVVALIALPVGAEEQKIGLAQSARLAESADTTALTFASAEPAATVLAKAGSATEISQLTDDALNLAADTTSVNDISLDDPALSPQRGGPPGMVMMDTAPSPASDNGGSVTLWDEIAPPAPLPVPVDAARAAQGNVASYQGK